MARLTRLIAIALLVAGCASAVPSPPSPAIRDEMPPVARGQIGRPTVACLPDGMPPFSEWRDGPITNRGTTTDDLGQPVRLLVRPHVFGHGEHRSNVVGFWQARPPAYAWRVYAIDPAPGDPTVPFWYDASVVSVEDVTDREVKFSFGMVRDGCDWRRVGLAAMRV